MGIMLVVTANSSPLHVSACPAVRALRTAMALLMPVMLLLFAPWLGVAHAQAPAWETGSDGLLPIPPLAARVTDLAHTLAPAEQQALEAKLADWEARTSNQLAVLIVPTTQPK